MEEGDGVWRGMEGEYVVGSGRRNLEAEVEEVGGGGGVGRIEGIRKRKLKESCHWLAETCKSYRTSSEQPLVLPFA